MRLGLLAELVRDGEPRNVGAYQRPSRCVRAARWQTATSPTLPELGRPTAGQASQISRITKKTRQDADASSPGQRPTPGLKLEVTQAARRGEGQQLIGQWKYVEPGGREETGRSARAEPDPRHPELRTTGKLQHWDHAIASTKRSMDAGPATADCGILPLAVAATSSSSNRPASMSRPRGEGRFSVAGSEAQTKARFAGARTASEPSEEAWLWGDLRTN